MKFVTPPILLVAVLSGTAQAVDYFVQFTGGNPTIHGQRMRFNVTMSPGVSEPPYNPDDHFSRITLNGIQLVIVPTHPHPPPVPGYYALSGNDNIDGAYKLVQTYRPEEEGTVNLYEEWNVQQKGDGHLSLRYGDSCNSESHWIAVQETTGQGVRRWVPWWVKPTAGNMAALAEWDYEIVDVELVEARGPVNSEAPGGVEE
jgi:hypothetical protein